MPNWCFNQLIISGDNDETIREFISNGEVILDFNKIAPYPEKYQQMDSEWEQLMDTRKEPNFEERFEAYKTKWQVDGNGFNSGGYGWRLKHWGTKWNAVDTFISDYRVDNLVIGFDTAWSPPLPVIQELSKQFPEAEFTINFEEPGMGFFGEYKYSNGYLIEERNFERVSQDVAEDDEDDDDNALAMEVAK